VALVIAAAVYAVHLITVVAPAIVENAANLVQQDLLDLKEQQDRRELME